MQCPDLLWGRNQPVISEAVSPIVDWAVSETDRSGPFGTEAKKAPVRLEGLVLR